MSEIPKKFAKVSMLKRAYIEGHAVGKVEGSEETLDAVKEKLSRLDSPCHGCLGQKEIIEIVEALRKKVSE